EVLVLQCLRRVPSQRPSTMLELHERLLALAQPYAIPFLEGAGYALAETDPGLAALSRSASSPGLPRLLATAPTPGAPELHDDEGTEPFGGGRPTGEIPGAMPRPRSPRTMALAAGAALVVGVALLALLSFGRGDDRADESDEPATATPRSEMVTLSFSSTP